MKLRKGMEFTHKDTKVTIIYGKRTDDGKLWCIDKKTKSFLKVTEEELASEYHSNSALNKDQKNRRASQAW